MLCQIIKNLNYYEDENPINFIIIDFFFSYIYNDSEYIFDTVEVKEVLDGMPLNDPSVIRMLTEMVNSNIEELRDAK